MSKKGKVISAIIALVLLLCVAIFIVAGNKLSNPENVLKKYYASISEDNWSKAYTCISFTEGDFINRHKFAETHKNDEHRSISDVKLSKALDNDSNSKKYFWVAYKENGQDKSDYVEMVYDGKYMLFWESYKISEKDFITKNYIVKVRENSIVYIDGVEISDKYIVETESDKSKNMEAYKLESILSGQHVVKSTNKLYEDCEKEVLVNNEKTVLNLFLESKVKEEIVNELKERAKNDLKNALDSVAAGKSGSDIAGIFEILDNRKDNLSDSFNKYKADMKPDNKGLTKASITKTSETAESGMQDGRNYINVIVTAAVDYSYQSMDEASVGKNASDTTKYTFTYVYSEGKWKIYSWSLGRLNLQ